MAFSGVIQGAKAGGLTSVTTDAVDTTGKDLIVLSFNWYAGASSGFTGAPTVSDSAGNTWTALTERSVGSGDLIYKERIYYCVNPTTSATHTFTASGVNGYWSAGYVAATGAHATPLDQQAGSGATTGTTLQPGSITPTANGCLLISGCDFSSGTTGAINSGFTASAVDYVVEVNVGGGIASLVQATAAAINPQWSWTTDGYNVGSTVSFLPAAGGGDVTAPVLSSPVGTQTGSTTATIGATTDEGNGTLYGVVTTSITAPTATQIKAGQDHAGSAAVFAGSTAVGSTGAKTISATGLTAATAYYAHLMHEDSSANQSNVVTSAQFTTAAGVNTISVTDAALFFSPYNWYKSGSTYAQTVNPGAYIKTQFTGTSVKLNVDVTPQTGASVSAGNYPAIIYSVDGAAWTRYQLQSSDTQLTLGTGLTDTTHTLDIVFVGVAWNSNDRWTTPALCLRITGLELDSGDALVAPTTYANRLIVFDDSHGEGHEILAAGVSVANQDASQAYPYILGRAFNAEVGVVAFAGQGYTASVATANVPDLEDAWDFIYGTNSRLTAGAFTDGEPDWIVSGHGDNDSNNAAVATAVSNLIAAWRAAAPNAAILLVHAPNYTVQTGIENGHTAAGDANSFVIDHGDSWLVGKWQNGSHLNLRGHALFAATVARLSEDAVSVGGGLAGSIFGSGIVRSL